MQQPSYLRFLLDKACAKRIPVSGTFELTPRCNFNCRMCYIHSQANDNAVRALEMDTAWWLALAEQLRACGTLTLLLTGGEPLLRPDFSEIYKRCRKLGLLVSVNTNAALMTEKTIDLFAQYKPVRLNVSLYGASEQTYCALCQTHGAYERVRENLLALRARDVDIKLNYTVSAYNKDDAFAVYEFGRQNGMAVQAATYLYPTIRACESDACTMCRQPAQITAAYQYQCDLLRLTPQEMAQRRKAAALLQAPAEEPQSDLMAPEERIFCRAGTSAFWVTWDAKLLACGMLPSPACDLKTMQFSQAWEQIKTETAQLRLPARCTSCEKRPFCELCAANCFAENGRTDEVPQYLCEKTDAYLKLLREKT